jgi:hypothetical protein
MVHYCTSTDCGKSWAETDEAFPLCITNPCPLREIQKKLPVLTTDLFVTSPSKETLIGSSRVAAEVSKSLTSLRDSCGKKFVAYDLTGYRGAKTTVKLPDGITKVFKTTDLQHSEMMAIDWMIENGHWTVFLGTVQWEDGSPVTPEQFSTDVPHCGFCTIFLIAAMLPISIPTCGNHKHASRLSYQLPHALEVSPHFIARVLDGGCYSGFSALKRVLNAFVKESSDKWLLSIGTLAYVNDLGYISQESALKSGLKVVDWYALARMHKREVIWCAWKVVYENIKNTNDEGAKAIIAKKSKK